MRRGENLRPEVLARKAAGGMGGSPSAVKRAKAATGKCPACHGYGWPSVEVKREGDATVRVLATVPCRLCGGAGRIGKGKRERWEFEQGGGDGGE